MSYPPAIATTVLDEIGVPIRISDKNYIADLLRKSIVVGKRGICEDDNRSLIPVPRRDFDPQLRNLSEVAGDLVICFYAIVCKLRFRYL